MSALLSWKGWPKWLPVLSMLWFTSVFVLVWFQSTWSHRFPYIYIFYFLVYIIWVLFLSFQWAVDRILFLYKSLDLLLLPLCWQCLLPPSHPLSPLFPWFTLFVAYVHFADSTAYAVLHIFTIFPASTAAPFLLFPLSCLCTTPGSMFASFLALFFAVIISLYSILSPVISLLLSLSTLAGFSYRCSLLLVIIILYKISNFHKRRKKSDLCIILHSKDMMWQKKSRGDTCLAWFLSSQTTYHWIIYLLRKHPYDQYFSSLN